MKSVNSNHFKIYFTQGSIAESEIDFICSKLESGYMKIISELNIKDNFPIIKFYLYPTRKEKVKQTGEEANANTDRKKFKVFAIYNKNIKPIAPHEIVHILTNSIGLPNFVLNEGFAESFCDTWRAVINGKLVALNHDDWVKRFINENKYITIFELYDDSKFWDFDSSISYPECGSFFKYLRQEYSLEQIKSLIKSTKRNGKNEDNLYIFKDITGKSLAEVEDLWIKKITN